MGAPASRPGDSVEGRAYPAEQALVLLIDDDPALRRVLGRWMRQADYLVESAQDGRSGLDALSRMLPDVVVLDLEMPGMDGLDVLRVIKGRHPHLPVVIFTGDRSIEKAVRAMQLGAYDYVTKPADKTRLETALQRAIEHARLSLQVRALARQVEPDGEQDLVGRSPAMRLMFRQMDRVAPSEVTVLVQGESGTGKELVARAIHRESARASGPFVAINCAAIPEQLQESELFGHERGAFTNAIRRHMGRFEQADGGTLFLDEVAELDPGLQAKLLRVLQERRFYRVGGREEVAVDIRLITATHRDLVEEVQTGRFREDLYFRLAVFELEIPPLRERGQDVLLLAEHLLTQHPRSDGRWRLSSGTRALFTEWSWPGNVRELENVIERAVLLAHDGIIRPEDLPRRMRGEVTPRQRPQHALFTPPRGSRIVDPRRVIDLDRPTTMAEVERRVIEAAINRHGGDVRAAAAELNIGRATIYRRLKEYRGDEPQ